MNEIDDYIAVFPEHIQQRLIRLGETIREALPETTENISNGMPTFFLKGNLVHYAGYPNHIGFYPAPSGISAFLNELSAYKNAKGSVKFPHDKPLPPDLIASTVRFRVVENMAIKK